MDELATRRDNGIHGRLLWRRSDNRVVVTVDSTPRGCAASGGR
jgi:hypothetical protein